MLQPAGAVVDVTSGVSPEALAETIIACVAADVPFVVAGDAAPAVTSTDAATGVARFGILNVLAVAAGAAGRSVVEGAMLLTDEGTFAVEFGGLNSPAGRTRTTPVHPATRGPLLAIATPDPDGALRSLAAHMTSR
jgi:hypothetical protein